MDARTAKLAEWFAETLAAFPEVRTAILFGSRARGDNRERSDVDIAIDAPDASAVRWSDIVEAVDEAPTLLQLDILRFESLSASMKEQIEHDGVVVYDFRTRAA